MPQRRITTRGHKTTEAGQSFTQDPNLPPPPILRIDQEKASQDGQDNGGELDEEDSLPVRGQVLRGYKQYTHIKLYKNNRYLQYLLEYVPHSSGYNN